MKPRLIYGALLLLIAQTLSAQSPDGPGRVALGAYFNGSPDSINLYNGNLMLNIGVISQSGRELSTGVQLFYNAQGWVQVDDPILGTYGYYAGGWKFVEPLGESPMVQFNVLDCQYYPEPGIFEAHFEFWVTWKDGSGAGHVYETHNIDGYYDSCDFWDAYDDYIANLSGTLWSYPSSSNDRTRLRITASSMDIVFPDGAILAPYPLNSTMRLTSRNGNYLESYGSGNGLPLQDTLGRSIGYDYEASGSTWFQKYTVKDDDGTDRDYQLNYRSEAVNDPYDTASENIIQITSISLPNGRSYTFDYDHVQGFLTKVTLPSDGYIEFDYAGGNSSESATNDYVVERRVSPNGSAEETWAYARSDVGGVRTITVTTPESEVIEHKFDMPSGFETSTEWKNASASVSQKVLKQYSGGVQTETQRDGLRQVTTVTYTQFDGISLPTQQDQSDWSPISGSLVPLTRTTTTYSSSFPRVPTEVELQKWTGSSYVTQGKTAYFYDEYSLTSTSDVYNKSTPEYARRNVTTVRRYKDASNYVEEHSYYDDLGNVLTHVDARGKTTTFSYADNFTSNPEHNTQAFPTLVTRVISGEADHQTETQYHYETGLPVLITDPRGLETTLEYDMVNRTVEIAGPGGRGGSYAYSDTPSSGTLTVTENANMASGVVAKTETIVDLLYRPIKVKVHDPDGAVYVDTVYDGNGRAVEVSQPYRSGDPDWSVTTYDVLGRPLEVTNPDNTTVEFVYSGNTVTVTDEAGNQRRQTTNALGQLTKVEEPNPTLSSPLETTYSYYVFGPLASVTQGSQTRSFTSDWLGRVTQETHPETGITSFEYDSGGLVTRRTDARGKITDYEYDDLGRLVDIDYGDGTPDVHNDYDQSGYVGYLTAVDVAGITASTFTYNDGGQLSAENLTFDDISGTTFTTGYSYDLGGRLASMTYPSGRTVTYTYDDDSPIASSRLALLKAGVGQSLTTLVESVTDNAAGQVTARTLSTGIAETRTFNSRNQLTGIAAAANSTTLMSLGYGYGTTDNNGRIRTRTDAVQPEHSAEYTYDAIGRLTEVENAAWSLGWTLDRYGNRNAQSVTGLASGRVGSQSITHNTKNQITASVWTYDAAGNVTRDGAGYHYTYDAESRLIQIESSATEYAYDAAGRRVWKKAGGVTTYYIYGLTGLISEFNTVDTGVTAAASNDRIRYRVGEQTGTPVMLADANGIVRENNRVFPFGEPWSQPVASETADKFTSYQRDGEAGEAGLDYAMARHYASRSGRFMTPDPGHIGADPGNPQSWNAYTYSFNDPINFTDPSGLCPPEDENIEDCYQVEVTVRCGFWCQLGMLLGGDGEGAGGAGGGFDFGWWPSFDDWTKSLMLQQATVTAAQEGLDPTNANRSLPESKPCAAHGWVPRAGGMVYGVAGDLGAGLQGVTAQGSIGQGIFYDGNNGFSSGFHASGGAAAYMVTQVAGRPAQSIRPANLGTYAGAGLGFYLTNAASANQLEGKSRTFSINVGLGPVKGSFQFSWGGGIWQATVSPPIPLVNPGLGGSVSLLDTSTVAYGGC